MATEPALRAVTIGNEHDQEVAMSSLGDVDPPINTASLGRPPTLRVSGPGG